jgi:hypothetical protein
MALDTDSYRKQVADIQKQLAGLYNQTQTPPVIQSSPQPMIIAQHKIPTVSGIAGAEAHLSSMPAGSSDIAANASENIIYLLAKDVNGVPQPIQMAKYDFINPQDDPSGYVTRKDFDDFKMELKNMLIRKGE